MEEAIRIVAAISKAIPAASDTWQAGLLASLKLEGVVCVSYQQPKCKPNQNQDRYAVEERLQSFLAVRQLVSVAV
jgi:hypothetical protein